MLDVRLCDDGRLRITTGERTLFDARIDSQSDNWRVAALQEIRFNEPPPTAEELFEIEGRLSLVAVPTTSHHSGRGLQPVTVCFDSMQETKTEWLWRDYLPCGEYVILAGDPGTGKTTLAMTIAAAVSTGGELVDGTTATQGSVLIVTAEDSPEKTIRGRLRAAGAELSRCHSLPIVRRAADGSPIPWDVSDVNVLEQAIEEAQASLVVLDPLQAMMPDGTDTHRNTPVRRALLRVTDLAQRHGFVLLGIDHLRKQGADNPVYRVSGSIAFTGRARVVLMAMHHPDGDEKRAFGITKTNLGLEHPAWDYRLVPLDPNDADSPVIIEWGDQNQETIKQLMGRREVREDPEAAEEGAELATVLRKKIEPAPFWEGAVSVLAEDLMMLARDLGRALKAHKNLLAARGVKVEPGEPKREAGTGRKRVRITLLDRMNPEPAGGVTAGASAADVNTREGLHMFTDGDSSARDRPFSGESRACEDVNTQECPKVFTPATNGVVTVIENGRKGLEM